MFQIVMLCAALTLVAAAPIEQETILITPKFINTVQQHINKCEGETKPPPDTFKNMLKGFIENEASLKFMYCYLLEAGFIAKDGHMNIPRVQSLLPNDNKKEELANAFNECNKLSGSDHLDTLRLLLGCYKDNSPVIFTL